MQILVRRVNGFQAQPLLCVSPSIPSMLSQAFSLNLL